MILTLWTRIPVVVRAVASGLVLASIVTVPWGALVSANLRHWPIVPWSVPPVLLYLWAWWHYVSGKGWPQSTSRARRANLRALPVSDEAWGAALVAGMLGLTTSVLLVNAAQRLAPAPVPQLPDVSHVPILTLLSFQLTGAAVAGIAEEASFRGYMQAPIERRHGPIVAIAITAIVFASAHAANPEFSPSQAPLYLGVAATFGTIAYLTGSILPGMALHVGVVVLDGLGELAGAQQSWQAAPGPALTLSQAASDPSFLFLCGAVVVVGALTVSAYVMLARTARRPSRSHEDVTFDQPS